MLPTAASLLLLHQASPVTRPDGRQGMPKSPIQREFCAVGASCQRFKRLRCKGGRPQRRRELQCFGRCCGSLCLCGVSPTAPLRFCVWFQLTNTYPWVRSHVDVAPCCASQIPFLGMFTSEEGCQQACEQLSNCTQYQWSGRVEGSAIYTPWNNHCYGRCDDVWDLHSTPHGGVPGVSARRVPAAL